MAYSKAKCRPFHASHLFTEIKMNEDHVSCLLKIIGITKHLEHHKHSPAEIDLVLIVDYISLALFYSLIPFSSLLLIFFLISLHIHTWTQHISVNLPPCWL